LVSIKTSLIKSELLTPPEVDYFLEISRQEGVRLWEVLLRENKITESWLAETFSRQLKVPLVALSTEKVDPDAAHRIPESLARKHSCVPFAFEGAFLQVAFVDPADLEAIRAVEFYTGCKVQPVAAPRTEVLRALEETYARSQAVDIIMQASGADSPEFQIVAPGNDLDLNEENAVQASEAPPIVKLVNIALFEAIQAGASDIHIEPSEHEVRIRLRVDGVLRDFFRTPSWLHPGLTTRLKVLSKLDIAEKRTPQDGRFKVHYQNKVTEVRLSTLPTQFGEKAVLRLLGSSQGIPDVKTLGIPEETFGTLIEAVMQPQGMIIATGPTGSGKSTTLYSLMDRKRSSEVNIVTVEDPIEYRLEGANQVQVNPKAGLTFAGCLRSILRQDPDAILVGEIRDKETADIAFHAAMTGHLVLTSLHTNSSIATIMRLLDLGVDPFVITSSITLIIAQRLARTTCHECREIYSPTPRVLARIKWDDPSFAFVRGKGCKACHGTGFRGRVGIYEILKMTPAVRAVINERGSEAKIRRAALASGFISLLQEAHEKIREGITSPDEVLRVIQSTGDDEICCPHCGEPVPEETGQCLHCGNSAALKCQDCGEALAPEWIICPHCGTQPSRASRPVSSRGTADRSASMTRAEYARGTKDHSKVQ